LDKILNFIKRLFFQLIKVVIFIIKEVFYFFPFYIILLIGFNFISISAEDKFSIEQLKIILQGKPNDPEIMARIEKLKK